MADESRLPAVFGRYLLLQRLSRGGMGEIFLGKLGEIQGFEKPIVIKKILPSLSLDRDFVERFIAEAKIAINLSHANIVPVYEVGMVDNQYFLAMDYVAGRDLRALAKKAARARRPVPPDLALLIIREVASGLAYAHRRRDDKGQPLGLVHCDISPPNVLISFEGEVKIIDFGIARSDRQRDEGDLGFGKFGYMAPEQLVRGGVLDRRTDVYAAGVLLFELLTGTRLFKFAPDEDLRKVARVVTAGRIDPPSTRNPKLSEAVDALVLRALRTNPGERFSTAEELRDALQQELYALNPTISGDSLAGYLEQLYPDGLDADRRMLQVMSRADLGAFRGEFSSSAGQTVSFAQAAVYTQHSIGVVTPLALPPKGEEGGRNLDSTRALSQSERLGAARAPGVRRGLQFAKGPLLLAVAALAVAVVGYGVASLVLLGPSEGGKVPDMGVDASRVVLRMVMDSGGPDQPIPTFAPQAVHRTRSSGRRPRKYTRTNRPRRHRGAAKTTKTTRATKATKTKAATPTPPGPTKASVSKKFRRVKAAYGAFERAYGGRLKSDWQRILFAHTYGRADPARMDAMLDSLAAKMRSIRSTGVHP